MTRRRTLNVGGVLVVNNPPCQRCQAVPRRRVAAEVDHDVAAEGGAARLRVLVREAGARRARVDLAELEAQQRQQAALDDGR